MRWLHSRVIRKTFVSYIAVLYLFFLCFALFSFQEIKKRTQEDIEVECVRSAKAMAFTIDQNFSRIQSSTLKLSQLPWIWSFSVTDLTFSNQFLPSDRRDIVSDLQVLAENDNLIQNLTVFFPQKNVAVSSKGWFSTDRYLDMVRSNLPQLWQALEQRRNFDVVYLDREAMAKSPVIWMLNTLDRSAPPRIQLAFSFDKNILANWVSAISFSRFRQSSAKKRGGGSMQAVLDELAEVIADPSDVEDALDAHELSETVRKFIRELPEREGDVFLRRYFFSESMEEIAGAYGITVNNTAVILSRTRKKLRLRLIREGYLYESERSV